MNNLTLIIPAKNEHESLPIVLKSLIKFKCAITVSLKKNDLPTIKAIKKFKVNIHKQSKFGYGNSLTEAITKCKTKYFCIFNADGSFNPSELPKMTLHLKKANLDFVFASRYQKNSGSEDDTIITLIGNKIFTLLGKIFFNLPITDILYTFVLGRTDKAIKLQLELKDFGFCVELPIKANRMNMKIESSSSYERKRIAGFKKVSAFKDGLSILIHMIKLFCWRNK